MPTLKARQPKSASTEEGTMKLAAIRRAAIALGTALAMVAITAAQALAGGGPGPFPK
jgi:hypothetical protein